MLHRVGLDRSNLRQIDSVSLHLLEDEVQGLDQHEGGCVTYLLVGRDEHPALCLILRKTGVVLVGKQVFYPSGFHIQYETFCGLCAEFQAESVHVNEKAPHP